MNPLHPLFENWMLASRLYIHKYFFSVLHSQLVYNPLIRRLRLSVAKPGISEKFERWRWASQRAAET